MKKDFVDLIMNPARQRIVQYLMLHKTGTVSEIAAELNDIPRPSIYRHIRLLSSAGLIAVESERTVRGAVERTYALVQNPVGEPSTNEIAAYIQQLLLSLSASFTRYFAQEDIDPQKDMLSVSSSTLLLSDSEFVEFFGRIGQVYNDYISNKPEKDRKMRCITIISSPPSKTGKGE